MDKLRIIIRKLLKEALVLKKHNASGKLVAVSDETDTRKASSETFKNKEALKKDNLFTWDGNLNAWSTDVSNFTAAMSRLSVINKKEYLISKLEDVEELVMNSDSPTKANLADRITMFINDLANATDEKAADAKIKQYLNFFSKFKGHSFTNTILIWIQRPDATKVAGFRQWEEKLHRRVIKGAKGIQIFAPIIKKGEEVVGSPDVDDTKKVVGYKAVYVFDVSDTQAIDERGEIPETPEWFDNNTPSELADKLYQYTLTLSNELGINITTDASKSGEQGYSAGNHINLSSTVAGVARLSTMIHELAHELMHRKSSSPFYSLDNVQNNNTRELKELQAESVSYTVLKHYNLPAQHHATYLAMWKANKDAIKDNLSVISKVSRFIIDKLDSIAESQLQSSAA